MSTTSPEITKLLQAWSAGDQEAFETLLPLIYDDLRRMARYFFQRESSTHTLQPTALVNEIYLQLDGNREIDWQSRKEFFAFAAQVMRNFLVGYDRRRKAKKRGGDVEHLPLEPSLLAATSDVDLSDLDEALKKLAEIDPRQAHVVELRYFVGLKIEEIAELLKVSEVTVKRDWRTAKLWLRRFLDGKNGTDEES